RDDCASASALGPSERPKTSVIWTSFTMDPPDGGACERPPRSSSIADPRWMRRRRGRSDGQRATDAPPCPHALEAFSRAARAEQGPARRRAPVWHPPMASKVAWKSDGAAELAALPFAPGEAPFRVKGTAHRGHLEYVAQHVPGGVAAMCEAFEDPRQRAFFAQPFLAASLYDV